MSNTFAKAGKVTVTTEMKFGYHPDRAVYIKIGDSSYLGYSCDVLSIEQAEAIRDGLTKIIDEVKARKPKEPSGPEKIAKLANGTHFGIHDIGITPFVKTGSKVTSIYGSTFSFEDFEEDEIFVDEKVI